MVVNAQPSADDLDHVFGALADASLSYTAGGWERAPGGRAGLDALAGRVRDTAGGGRPLDLAAYEPRFAGGG